MRAVLPALIAGILLLASCQPSTRARMAREVKVDSTLYFSQKDIEDPFLDRLKQHDTSGVRLTKTYFPPPPPEPVLPSFKEVEGFRVQLFAGIDSLNAVAAVRGADPFVEDTLYLLNEKGLFKVQAGDFQFRPGADAVRTKLRRNGYPGAWVIRRMIRIPIARDSSMADQKDTSGSYRIQVLATSSQQKAGEIVSALEQNAGLNGFYEKSGNLYKVFVGLFDNEPSARQALARIRDLGYADAWLVY